MLQMRRSKWSESWNVCELFPRTFKFRAEIVLKYSWSAIPLVWKYEKKNHQIKIKFFFFLWYNTKVSLNSALDHGPGKCLIMDQETVCYLNFYIQQSWREESLSYDHHQFMFYLALWLNFNHLKTFSLKKK